MTLYTDNWYVIATKRMSNGGLNILSQLIRRQNLHTFSDEKGLIFTVTNAPPIIPHIATTIDPETLATSSIGALRRPQLNIGRYPEIPFLLRSIPFGDPLLSRLCASPENLPPVQYAGGWALPDDIRKAWIQLEKGLLYVSDLLLTSSEQSSCGTSARYAIRDQPHWPPPEDYGYRKLHSSGEAAQTSIHGAHTAFHLLVARCSLAVALWLFPGPRDGEVHNVRTSHYNYSSDESVPDWVAFLVKEGVPPSWIDAVADSMICDFSLNQRVGAVFDPNDQHSLPILPVLRAANVPVFVWWRNVMQVRNVAEFPFMKPFVPYSPQDVHLALDQRPAGQPRVVTLCREGNVRPCPDYSAVDDITPPFGPFQLPGETRAEFFSRRERFLPDQRRQETSRQAVWRRQRMTHAESGFPPFRRSRVYLWVKAEILFPDLPPRWRGVHYRHPMAPAAYRSLWMIHPAGYRKYNPYFDEWDLWFPPWWEQSEDDTTSDSSVIRTIAKATPHLPAPAVRLHATPAEKAESANVLCADDALRIAAPDGDEMYDVEPQLSYHLSSWYGITIADTRKFTGVDYHSWADRLPQVFSEQHANIPQAPEMRALIAGWVSAMLKSDLRSRALEHTWDLDPRNSTRLMRDGTVRSALSMDQVRAPSHVQETDDIVHWVVVKFRRDPESHPWSILTSAMGALLLARRLREADSSKDALSVLMSVGVPFRTGIHLERTPPPFYALPIPSMRRLFPPWRKKGDRPTVSDYDSYCQRVLEIAHRPHARAAWLKGGIVWRIMHHVTGRESPFADVGGPSDQVDHHVPVTLEDGGAAYYDDGLSLRELDIIAGVVKVYTGTWVDVTHRRVRY